MLFSFQLSKFQLWKSLHRNGFHFGKASDSSRLYLFERPDIVAKRMQYLRAMKAVREQGRHIVYLDETWVDTNTYPKKQVHLCFYYDKWQCSIFMILTQMRWVWECVDVSEHACWCVCVCLWTRACVCMYV